MQSLVFKQISVGIISNSDDALFRLGYVYLRQDQKKYVLAIIKEESRQPQNNEDFKGVVEYRIKHNVRGGIGSWFQGGMPNPVSHKTRTAFVRQCEAGDEETLFTLQVLQPRDINHQSRNWNNVVMTIVHYFQKNVRDAITEMTPPLPEPSPKTSTKPEHPGLLRRGLQRIKKLVAAPEAAAETAPETAAEAAAAAAAEAAPEAVDALEYNLINIMIDENEAKRLEDGEPNDWSEQSTLEDATLPEKITEFIDRINEIRLDNYPTNEDMRPFGIIEKLRVVKNNRASCEYMYLNKTGALKGDGFCEAGGE